MGTVSKWIKFIEYNPFRIDGRYNLKKTTTYWVINKENKTRLGEIKWYGSFRQYSFFPEPDMVFEKTCLQDITDFIKQLEAERKENIKLRKRQTDLYDGV